MKTHQIIRFWKLRDEKRSKLLQLCGCLFLDLNNCWKIQILIFISKYVLELKIGFKTQISFDPNFSNYCYLISWNIEKLGKYKNPWIFVFQNSKYWLMSFVFWKHNTTAIKPFSCFFLKLIWNTSSVPAGLQNLLLLGH